MIEYEKTRQGMCCMNYEVFDALNAGTLCRAEDETEQAFIELVNRVL